MGVVVSALPPMLENWLANEIEPLVHLKILDGDDDGCLATSTMIEEIKNPSPSFSNNKQVK